MEETEKYWRQYDKHVELYKFYLDLVVKINVFHFAISGAIFSFYFANKSEPSIQWSLALPGLLSFCLLILFAYGAVMNRISRKDVFDLRDKLKLKVAPELMVLTVFLGIFCLANLFTLGGVVYVIYSHCT